jgi:exo-1,4-beta-D-glucosaminidase
MPPIASLLFALRRTLLAVGVLVLSSPIQAAPAVTPLKAGWAIFPAERVEVPGERIARPDFDAEAWYPAKVPSTVLGNLVDLGIYGNVFLSKNLGTLPTAPFQQPWWYRTEFTVAEAGPGVRSRLVFEGINYRAEVYLNGRKVAGKDQIAGVWRVHDLDVSGLVHKGRNVLAVKVHRAQPGEFTLGFVDWNPAPPDGSMGIFRPVSLRQTGTVSLEQPVVRTQVALPSLASADLMVDATLVNHGDSPATGVLEGQLGEVRFEVPFRLKAKEQQRIHLTPAAVSALHLQNPRLWWPVNLGSPELYTLALEARTGGGISDAQTVTFGVREVGDYLNAQGHRGYKVNGRPVLIRGGGWVDDLFLREEGRQLEAQLAYVKHMNLNAIRLEGFWGASQQLYDLADRMGILVMAGFSCQWEWPEYLQGVQESDGSKPFGGPFKPKDITTVVGYLRDQARYLRNHPSLLVWVVGSDKEPYPEAEKRYRALLAEEDPTRPILVSAKGWTSPVSGPSAVKMNGPYDYVTPNYWFSDRSNGGAFGFNTETGPGPQIPPLSSLKKMFLGSRLWPINDEWDYHCARYAFGTIDRYYGAFKARYGEPKDVETFAYRAQAANYEAAKAMFEAFGTNQPEATGVVQWMLNAAWPKLYWQLYDHYLMPNGAFYGTRKGSQPLNLVWDCAHHTLHAVNDTRQPLSGARARVRIFRLDSSLAHEVTVPVDVAAGAAVSLGSLPALAPFGAVSFLDLQLLDAKGALLSRNFYWMSAKPDVLAPETGDWLAMGNTSYADFRALDTLRPAQVTAETHFDAKGCDVTLSNDGDSLAFLLELNLVAEDGEPVVPLLWEDNYLSLPPKERRRLRVTFLDPVQAGKRLRLQVRGWNLKP